MNVKNGKWQNSSTCFSVGIFIRSLASGRPICSPVETIILICKQKTELSRTFSLFTVLGRSACMYNYYMLRILGCVWSPNSLVIQPQCVFITCPLGQLSPDGFIVGMVIKLNGQIMHTNPVCGPGLKWVITFLLITSPMCGPHDLISQPWIWQNQHHAITPKIILTWIIMDPTTIRIWLLVLTNHSFWVNFSLAAKILYTLLVFRRRGVKINVILRLNPKCVK